MCALRLCPCPPIRLEPPRDRKNISTAPQLCGPPGAIRCRSPRSGPWSRPGSRSTRPPRGRNELRKALAVPRVLDQSLEPSLAGLVFFRAHHPISRRPAVGRRLCLEELPGGPRSSEHGFSRLVEPARDVFVRIDRRTGLIASLVRGAAGRMDEAHPLHLGKPAEVYGAPHASLAAQRYTLRRQPF